MDTLLRSEDMTLIQLYVPAEAAHDTVMELGDLGMVQFNDMNPGVNAFQRAYVGDIRRLSDLTRHLRYLTGQLQSLSIPIRPFTQTSYLLSTSSTGQFISSLSSRLPTLEERLKDLEKSYTGLLDKRRELEEGRAVVRETGVFFRSGAAEQALGSQRRSGSFELGRDGGEEERLLGGDEELGDEGESGLGSMETEFVAGTIDRTKMGTFERVLWRVMRGNLYMNWVDANIDIDDPASHGKEEGEVEKIRKSVFIIFAHGSDLVNKIRKIAVSMGASLYPIDSSAVKRNQKLQTLNSRIEDLNSILYQTDQTRRAELVKIGEQISAWWFVVKREIKVWETMNLWEWDSGRRSLIGEGWVPTRDLQEVRTALRRASENGGSTVQPILQVKHTTAKPPTYQRTNKFTEGFQSLIDSYGIASYGEINPGLFTVVTFPFLFAVMFGDVGHGIIMFLGALAMIMVEKRFPKGFGNELLDQPYYGRYIILLMGLFSIFTGLIYNDIFSLSLSYAPSSWVYPEGAEGEVEATKIADYTYPFGIDQRWNGADNYLIFVNSLKMKMSIVLGVIHMSFAICLQIPNFIHFKNRSSIWAEWLPQFLFMQSIFGYLVILIIYKWCTDWSTQPIQPPSLLQMLIYMFLSPGTVAEKDQIYSGQATVQVFLLLLAVVCVPWMLCTKPYLIWKEMHAIKAQGYEGVSQHVNDADDEEEEEEGEANGHGKKSEGEEEEGHDFSEVVIHQTIHTIEFCLGCISNTASYLRLWALSLAHAQLSEVLWEMTLKKSFGMTGVSGVIATFVLWAMWFVLSVCILVIMEGLSAFLHALRLHWVEFNSKFYGGSGYQFEPLTFKDLDDDYE